MSVQTPTWLNAEFVQKVLKTSEKDDSIEVETITTKPATQIGDNYMSDMIRITVEYSRHEKKEKKSLIVKIAPTVTGANHGMVAGIRAFETEIKMMVDTLAKMSHILNEPDYRLGARALYTEIGDPSFLVIDDLAPFGYRMADRQTGLDLEHCTLVMRGLAKFHASSVALCEKEPEQKLHYTRGGYHEDNPEMLKNFITDGVRILSKEVADWPELGSSAKSYSEKLLKLSKVCYKRATGCVKPRKEEFNVINHGDCWINNMMFRYDEEGNVTDHMFVDFQICLWSSPAIDILNFINMSATNDVYTYHREALIEEYLNLLTETMHRIGCKTKPPTMAELQKTLRDHEFLSVLSASVGLAFVLIDKGATKRLDEIISETDGSINEAFKGLAYRKMILNRLKEWNARGLLDV